MPQKRIEHVSKDFVRNPSCRLLRLLRNRLVAVFRCLGVGIDKMLFHRCGEDSSPLGGHLRYGIRTTILTRVSMRLSGVGRSTTVIEPASGQTRHCIVTQGPTPSWLGWRSAWQKTPAR